MAQIDETAFYICGQHGNMLNHRGNVYSNLIPIEKILYMEKRKKGPEFCVDCRGLGHWNGCFVLYCINCEKRDERQSYGLENDCGAFDVGIENNSDSVNSATNTYLNSITCVQFHNRAEDGMPFMIGEIDWNQIGDITLEDTFSIQKKIKPIQEIIRESFGTYFISRVFLPIQIVCLDKLSKEHVDLYQVQVDKFVDQYRAANLQEEEEEEEDYSEEAALLYEKEAKIIQEFYDAYGFGKFIVGQTFWDYKYPKEYKKFKEEYLKKEQDIQNTQEQSVSPCPWDFNPITGAYEPKFLVEHSSREETLFKKILPTKKKEMIVIDNTQEMLSMLKAESKQKLDKEEEDQDQVQESLAKKKRSRMCSRKRIQRYEDYDYSSDDSSAEEEDEEDVDKEAITVFLNEEKWFEMKVKEEQDQQAYELATQTGIFDFPNTYQQEYDPTYIGFKPHND